MVSFSSSAEPTFFSSGCQLSTNANSPTAISTVTLQKGLHLFWQVGSKAKRHLLLDWHTKPLPFMALFSKPKKQETFIKQKQFVYHYLNLQKEKEKLRGACDMFNVHHIPKCHWINCPIFDNAWQKPSFVKNRNDIDPHMSEIFKGVLNCGQMRTTVIEMSKVFLTSSPFWGEFWDG